MVNMRRMQGMVLIVSMVAVVSAGCSKPKPVANSVANPKNNPNTNLNEQPNAGAVPNRDNPDEFNPPEPNRETAGRNGDAESKGQPKPDAAKKSNRNEPKPAGPTDESTGEKVLPADKAPASAPLRARKDDTLYRLTNPRIGNPISNRPGQPAPPRPPGSSQVLAIDYERVFEGKVGQVSVMIRTAGGKDLSTMLIGGLTDRGGVIQLVVPYQGPWTGSLPKDAEIYLTCYEAGYGSEFRKTFKISNSVVMGTTNFPTTWAREWTEAEAKILSVPPVVKPAAVPKASGVPPIAGPGARANSTVGTDTKVVGTVIPFKQRYAETDKPFLGVDVRDGAWMGKDGNEKCLSDIVPIYDRKHPDMRLMTRVLAKEGYAVGGMAVKSKTFVTAIKITFMKLTPDGKLDTKDSYTSPWVGPEETGTTETALGGDGKKVLGICLYKGAIVDGMALVMEK